VKLEEQAAQSRVIELGTEGERHRLGVIDIPAFYLDFEAYRNRDPDYKSTTRDVARILGELKNENVDGIIIDLRNNGGGSLHEATTLTDLFVQPGPVVQIRHTNQTISREYRSRTEPAYEGPLLVLINRLSASASEIFAAAIQDYGRGLVVGTRSFGKGTVQVLAPLPEGQLKLTESKFYRISGGSTQHRGVLPDISLPSIYDIEEIGESSQEHALPWDEIHGIPVNDDKTSRDSLVPLLKSRHAERAARDPDFIFLKEKLALFEKQREDNRVSLNLDERKREKAESERALLVLENKRRAAKGLQPYASVEAWEEAQDTNPSGEEAGEPSSDPVSLDDDPLLKEAGLILADTIDLSRDGGARLVQSRQ
jgi:carboxyl-terminal processing protease